MATTAALVVYAAAEEVDGAENSSMVVIVDK